MQKTTILAAILSVASCAPEQARIMSMDRGWTEVQGAPMVVEMPVYLDCRCSDIPCHQLVDAASWWNEQVTGRTGYGRPVVMVQPYVDEGTSYAACFRLRSLPPGVWSEEIGDFSGSRLIGRYLVLIEPDGWWNAVLRHAIGHLLGLADDPPTTTTLDLRSVMQADAPEWGEVTEQDAWLIVTGGNIGNAEAW